MFLEIPLQIFTRNVGDHRLGINAVAAELKRMIVDVGGENLQLQRQFPFAHVFAQQNGDRIGLLAGGASRNPDPHGIVGRLALEQLGDHALLQHLI